MTLPKRSSLSRSIPAPATEPAPPPQPTSAEMFVGGGSRDVAADMQAVVERLFHVDIGRDYDRIESDMTIGEKRTDYGTLMAALDRAEDNARIAHKLYITAKLERERAEMNADTVEAPMRDKAIRELEAEKEGGRKKQITEGDVNARIAEKWPDEYRSNREQRAKLKLAEEHLLRLADLLVQRCRSLNTMLATLRK